MDFFVCLCYGIAWLLKVFFCKATAIRVKLKLELSMNRLLIPIVAALLPLASMAQRTDERIGTLMNDGKWFEIEREMQSPALQDSLHPLLYGMCRTLTDHYFNRPDSSCVHTSELLQNHQQELGANALSMAAVLGMDMARANHYGEAADLMQRLADQLTAQGVDASETAGYSTLAHQYRVLDSIGDICKPLHTVAEYHIPMLVNNEMHKASGQTEGHFITMAGSINDTSEELVFDTGAGVNIISSRLAKECKLRPMGVGVVMQGIGKQWGDYMLADTLRIGEMTWKNVPFLVVDIETGDARADSIGTMLHPVIGLPIMLSMGEVRLDFEKLELVVPATCTPNPLKLCNMMRTDSEGLCLLAQMGDGTCGEFHFDTGSYLSTMSEKWYANHKAEVDRTGIPDSIRTAGVGGVLITNSYRIPEMKIQLGDSWATIDSVMVNTGIDKRTGKPSSMGLAGVAASNDGVIGLNLLERFSQVIINFKEMYVAGIKPRQD